MALFNIEIGMRASASLMLKRLMARLLPRQQPIDLFLCVVDHFEPHVGRASDEKARARMCDWLERYPKIVAGHRDFEGRSPVHTFFYPWDEYDPWIFERLTELCASGCGEIELHLHHRDDTSETLREKLRAALAEYTRFGALSRWQDGTPAFAFIHGNWALDNSRCEHGRNFCGVNNELTVLQEEGCYADFTFPSWKHTSQPRQVNSIYYAVDDPDRPKSYDRGKPMQVGSSSAGLLLVQGPMVPHLRRNGRPAMDDGNLAWSPGHRFQSARLDRWVSARLGVQGCSHRIFIKLHAHGAADPDRQALLGGDLDALFRDVEARYNDGHHFRSHYVSAREMFNILKATEAGQVLEISAARDSVLPRPLYAGPTEGRVSRKSLIA